MNQEPPDTYQLSASNDEERRIFSINVTKEQGHAVSSRVTAFGIPRHSHDLLVGMEGGSVSLLAQPYLKFGGRRPGVDLGSHVRSLVYSRDASFAMAATGDGHIHHLAFKGYDVESHAKLSVAAAFSSNSEFACQYLEENLLPWSQWDSTLATADGTHLVVFSVRLATGKVEEVARFDHGSPIEQIVWGDSKGISVFTVGDGLVRMWHTRRKTEFTEMRFSPSRGISKLARFGIIGNDRLFYAYADAKHSVWLSDAYGRDDHYRLTEHNGQVTDLFFTEDGLLVTASEDMTSRVLNPDSPTPEVCRFEHDRPIVALRELRVAPLLTPRSSYYLFADDVGHIFWWKEDEALRNS